MADPNELLPYINDHDTVVMATKDQFEQIYKPAGYRKLKANEPVPVQQAEVDEARAKGKDLPGSVPDYAETPTPQSVRRLRMERENGAVGDADAAERE